MRYVSLFSGIEAISVAAEQIGGFEPVAFAEIEKFPSAVLAQRFPNVPNLGDVTKVDWHEFKKQHGPIDLVCFGSPCQSFSVAGKRLGLDDPRGNLALYAIGVVNILRPEWFLFENVPGLLSSGGGRDFGQFLATVGECGYQCAWRILDAQYIRTQSHPWAVPQRRRRVFVVGHLGDWRRAAAVLFERESLSGHSPPRREAGKGIARAIEEGADGSGWPASVAPTFGTGWGDRHPGSSNQDWVAQKGGHFVPEICGALSDGAHNGGGLTAKTPIRDGLLPPAAMCLNAGAMGRQDAESETLIPTTGGVFDVAHSLKADGFDASGDGTGRGTPIITFPINTQIALRHEATGEATGMGIGSEDDPGFTLQAGHSHAVAFYMRGREDGSQFEGPHDTANIRAASGGSSRSYVAEMAVRRLTPLECERLQGLPEGHTAIEYRGKPAVDGPRYKAIGNSMACNVMNWLLGRIHESHTNIQREAA